MALGMIIPNISPIEGTENIDVSETLGMLSASPLGGETTINLPDVTGTVFLSWGFGLGIYLLLVAGVILMIAGGLEIIAKTTFFEQKQLVKKPIEKKSS
jgi:hypothetical protein